MNTSWVTTKGSLATLVFIYVLYNVLLGTTEGLLGTVEEHKPYSLVRLVWPNTEELISQPFAGLYKIRLLLQDCREQILVNKSDKSDHPHKQEPCYFVGVVNKVGIEAMPTKI